MDFCEKYGFEKDATAYLENAYSVLEQNKEEFDIFKECVKIYENDIEFDHLPVFSKIEGLAEKTNIHKYTLDMLYLIELTPHLKTLYKQKGISDDIYDASVCELKWKVSECKAVYDVWGTFVGWWSIGFFKMTRFGIGRLQFNLKNFTEKIVVNNFEFDENDVYIDTHIPSSGPLDYSECQESYKLAAEFFKDIFKDKPIVFGCRSWLLSPDNNKILPASSNILKFMQDYTLVKADTDPTNNNLWRIFGTFSLPENVKDLPQDTSVRRAFVKWLAEGNTINVGFGLIFFDESKEI